MSFCQHLILLFNQSASEKQKEYFKQGYNLANFCQKFSDQENLSLLEEFKKKLEEYMKKHNKPALNKKTPKSAKRSR